EHIARTLLRRYGVVCWRLLEREAGWLPTWRELLRVYHRLEARGEVRGGRFVAGLSGEQFALPEAVAALAPGRRQPPDDELLVLSASDPLTLAGTVLPGSKVPRLPGARVAYRNGVALAALVSGEIQLFAALGADDERAVRAAFYPNAASTSSTKPTTATTACTTTSQEGSSLRSHS